MPTAEDSSAVATWVQAGGLLAFASAVWWELRQLRPFMRDVAEALAVVRDRVVRDRAPRRPPSEPTSGA